MINTTETYGELIKELDKLVTSNVLTYNNKQYYFKKIMQELSLIFSV